jgi:hypothetical protein
MVLSRFIQSFKFLANQPCWFGVFRTILTDRRAVLAALLFLAALAPKASFAQQRVADEYLIANVPGLGPIYGARATWAIWRQPYIWTNGELLDISRIGWPQWEKTQIPLAIVPGDGAAKATLLLEAADGRTLEEIVLDAPFAPDRYDSSKVRPDRYRIRFNLFNERLVITTGAYPWIERKVVLECDYEIEQGKDTLADGRVKTCLSTLDSIAKNADRQWFATLTWPETGNAIRRNALSATDREFRSSFRKSGHVYESQRKGRRFLLRSGVTFVEDLPNIDFDYKTISKFSVITTAASAEEQKKVLKSSSTAAGGVLRLNSLSVDQVEQVALKSPFGPVPGLHIQFVDAPGEALSIKTTDFLENRTGVPGLLRKWRGRTFLNFNQLTSSRGEQSHAFGGPGVDLTYSLVDWQLEPYIFFDSGIFLPSDELSINELQFGLRRGFAFMPEWLNLYAGVLQYQLSGRNPGSSRLGASDSIAAGISAIQRIGDHVVQGRAGLLASPAFGFDLQFEYGNVWRKRSDFHLTWGVFLGVSRYASEVTIPTNRTTQELSEDRYSIGISFGFIGPESSRLGFSEAKLRSP